MSNNTELTRGYRVMVDDNFNYMDEGGRWCSGEFDTFEEAETHAKAMVDFFFADLNSTDSAKKMYQTYTFFGDDPFIVSFGGADLPYRFSSWNYAKSVAERRAGTKIDSA